MVIYSYYISMDTINNVHTISNTSYVEKFIHNSNKIMNTVAIQQLANDIDKNRETTLLHNKWEKYISKLDQLIYDEMPGMVRIYKNNVLRRYFSQYKGTLFMIEVECRFKGWLDKQVCMIRIIKDNILLFSYVKHTPKELYKIMKHYVEDNFLINHILPHFTPNYNPRNLYDATSKCSDFNEFQSFDDFGIFNIYDYTNY